MYDSPYDFIVFTRKKQKTADRLIDCLHRSAIIAQFEQAASYRSAT